MDRRETLAGGAVVRLAAVAGPRTKLQGSPDDTVPEVTGPSLDGTNIDLEPFGAR